MVTVGFVVGIPEQKDGRKLNKNGVLNLILIRLLIGFLKMKIKFNVKIDEYAGIIYERPIMKVNGSFDGETELEQFIEQLTKDIRKDVSDYINKK